MQRNKLKSELDERQKYQLCRYVEENKKQLMDKKINDISKTASSSLGFAVSDTDIMMAEDITGIVLGWPKGRNGVTGHSNDRLSYLAKFVADLAGKLGESVPTEVVSIIKREPIRPRA